MNKSQNDKEVFLEEYNRCKLHDDTKDIYFVHCILSI